MSDRECRNPLFRHDALAAFLKDLSGRANLFPLRDWDGRSGIILRHDVDLDVAPAVELAAVLAEIGLRSTFFFLTTAETYNLTAAANRKRLRWLDENGFEVGLHFDPTVHGCGEQDRLAAAALAEAAIIEDIIDREVRSISLHNPSVHGTYPLFDGWRNAYDPRIFSPDIYLSDSRQIFRTAPEQFFVDADKKTYQLLLHPMHYSADGAAYPWPVLNHLKRVAQVLDSTFAVNSSFTEAVPNGVMNHAAQAFRQWALDEMDEA